jgi:hypothetical protein
MLREIASFVGDAPQHDDMTMILLKVDPGGLEGQERQEEQEVTATQEPEFSLPALPAFPAR